MLCVCFRGSETATLSWFHFSSYDAQYVHPQHIVCIHRIVVTTLDCGPGGSGLYGTRTTAQGETERSSRCRVRIDGG